MDTQKIGKFLKTLRNGKNMTQEELAEYIHVSARTVSRWETGANLPDIAILIELADFYGVDIREILDGERKDQNMKKETEETILKVTEYNQEENKKVLKGGNVLFILGFLISVANLIIEGLDLQGEGFWYNLADFIRGFNDGVVLVLMLIGVLHTANRLGKIRETKERILGRKL